MQRLQQQQQQAMYQETSSDFPVDDRWASGKHMRFEVASMSQFKAIL
jgi:hypothetical protein